MLLYPRISFVSWCSLIEGITNLPGMQIHTRSLANATKFGLETTKILFLIAHLATLKSKIQVLVLQKNMAAIK